MHTDHAVHALLIISDQRGFNIELSGSTSLLPYSVNYVRPCLALNA